MNFDDSQEEADFRIEARDWIAANAIPLPETRRRRDATPEWLGIARDWQAKKADAGYVGIAWPKKWLGQARSQALKFVFDEEEARAGLHFTFFEIGLGLCVPTLASFSDRETIERLVPLAKRGENIWCQLFSEPSAGSDLAGIRTRADRDGDNWVVNGQKVWTSGGQFSDYAIVLTRTDPTAPKHRGMTMFWLSLDTPGIYMRPLRQASGEANFNEVFLTDVIIPDSQRLGAVDAGWQAAMTTLMNERVSIGDVAGPDIASAIALAKSTPGKQGSVADDRAFAGRMVDHYIRSEGVRLTRARMLTAISRGERPGPENSIAKLVAANEMQSLARDAILARGPMGMVVERTSEVAEGIFHDSLTWSPGYRIAGGTDEILRTIIAERVLGLPPEPRVDKGVPFNRIAESVKK